MRISSGTLVLGIFAVLFGLVGAYGVKQYLAEGPAAEPAARVERVTVPMAAVDLPAGRTISNADMVVRHLTWEQVRARGLTREFISQASQLVGRTLRTAIAKGVPFTPEDLYPEGTGPSVAERLRPGYRAVSVPMSNSQSEMALLSPGAAVDVMFRTFAKDNTPEATVTLLENVEILAIGDQTFPGGRVNAGNRGRQSAMVTLACTPEQASALKVIDGRGSLSLVLRGPEDGQLVGHSSPRTLEGLLNLPEPKPEVTTQIYRRGRRTTSVFADGRQVAETEGFGGLPIPAEDARPGVAPVSYARPARDAGDAGCEGCGDN